MKEFVDRLIRKKLIYRSLKEFNLKEIGVRKKVDVFIGIDEKDYYSIIFFLSSKSRFLQKNVDEIVKITDLVRKKEEHNFKNHLIFIDSPLCSKAKAKLKDLKWRVYDSV
ncbi:MAG: hypothetical protein OIF32_08410 [Campylobacterales bacterium]|nr:hypothetical protein [Campylobacterales bacterium]